MTRFESMKTYRFWSLTLGAISLVPMIFFVYQGWMFSEWAKMQASKGQFVCGTGLAAVFALCITITGLFTAVASFWGMVGYLKMSNPRPKRQLGEIAVIASLGIIAGAIGLKFF